MFFFLRARGTERMCRSLPLYTTLVHPYYAEGTRPKRSVPLQRKTAHVRHTEATRHAATQEIACHRINRNRLPDAERLRGPSAGVRVVVRLGCFGCKETWLVATFSLWSVYARRWVEVSSCAGFDVIINHHKGKEDGMLYGIHPVDLLAKTLNELVVRANVPKDVVEDVVCGVFLDIALKISRRIRCGCTCARTGVDCFV